jgi:hypothetical protein
LQLGGVELVDDGGDAGGEAVNALAEPVVADDVGAHRRRGWCAFARVRYTI